MTCEWKTTQRNHLERLPPGKAFKLKGVWDYGIQGGKVFSVCVKNIAEQCFAGILRTHGTYFGMFRGRTIDRKEIKVY